MTATPPGDRISPAQVAVYIRLCWANCGMMTRASVKDRPHRADQDAAGREIAILEDLEIDDGFFAINSQPIAPRMPRKATSAITQMNPDSNHASSSPRSIMICKAPSPRRDQRQADIIDAAAAFVFQPGRVLDQYRNE